MKLFFAAPSPFARKVRVLARELDLQGRIQEIAVHTTPVAPAGEVTAANPLSKIPTLVTDEGMSLYDSRVISEYLLSINARSQANTALTRAQDVARWTQLRRQALADGILDAGLAHRYETVLRPKDLHWNEWLDAQIGKIQSGLAELAKELPAPSAELDAIAIACTLGWLEFRMPDIAWRTEHPSLASFHDAMAERPSMLDTHPSKG